MWCSAGARRGIGDGYRRTEHMSDRVIAADENHETPDTQRSRVQRPAEHIAPFPQSDLGWRQRGLAVLISADLNGPPQADRNNQQCDRPEQLIAGLDRRHQSSRAGAHRPC